MYDGGGGDEDVPFVTLYTRREVSKGGPFRKGTNGALPWLPTPLVELWCESVEYETDDVD